jgi:hypothetical protein
LPLKYPFHSLQKKKHFLLAIFMSNFIIRVKVVSII